MSKHESDDPLIGTTIAGRYRIVRKIGAGGMGSVYLAEQGALRQEVALKILASDKVGSPQAVERFKKEALFVAGLKHPNIVGVYDLEVSEATGDFIMVMEYLRGMDLRDSLRVTGPRFPWQRTIPIVEDVCRALAAAHEQGVIHRDLKPENIFLVEGGRPDFAKVLDFGVAKATRADKQLTQTGMLVGTPSYIAPEQIKGRPVAASDLYSLGIMWFEMVAGRKPFVGEGVDLLWMHVDDEPPTLRQAAPDLEIPVLVEEMIGQLLEKNPRKRPGSAELLMEDLQTLIERSASGLRLPPPKTADPGATYDDEHVGRARTEASNDIFTELSLSEDDQRVQPTEISRRRPAAGGPKPSGMTDEEPVGVVTTGDLLSATGRSNHRLQQKRQAQGGAAETFVEGLSSDGVEASNPNHVGPMVDESEPTLAPPVPFSSTPPPGPNPNHVGPPSNDHEETYTTNERPSKAVRSVIASATPSMSGGVTPSHAFNSPEAPTRTIGVDGSLSQYLSGASKTAPAAPNDASSMAQAASMEGDFDRGEVTTGSGAMPAAIQHTSPYATQPPQKTSVLVPVMAAIIAGLFVVSGVGAAFWWFTKGPGANRGGDDTPAKVAANDGPKADAGAGTKAATGAGGRTIEDLSGRPVGPGEGEPESDAPPATEPKAADSPDATSPEATSPEATSPEAPVAESDAPEATAKKAPPEPNPEPRRRRRRRTRSDSRPEPESPPPRVAEPDPAPTPKTTSKRVAVVDVSVATRPSAKVIIDGRTLKRKTPLAGSNALKLKPGNHTLVLIDDAGERFTYRIRVPSNTADASKARVLVVLGGRATAKGGISISAK